MEKIHFDSAAYNFAAKKYSKAAQLLESCLTEYGKLEMGEPDQAVLDAILYDNANSYREKFEATINKAIEKTTKNTLLANELKKNIDVKFGEWLEKAQSTYQAVVRAINDGMTTYIPFNREYFKLEGQKVTFDHAALEAVYTISLDTDDRRQFYQLAVETAEKLNELQRFVAERNSAIFGTDVLPDIDGHCFQVDENRVITVNPNFVELV